MSGVDLPPFVVQGLCKSAGVWTCHSTGYEAPETALAQRRRGLKRVSPRLAMVVDPLAARNEPPSHRAEPSARRNWNAVSALPSSRFMPIQSQPTASGASSASLHSWSSHALPRTSKRCPCKVMAPEAASCGRL